MKYEKTLDTKLQFGARYQAIFNDAHVVEDAIFFLKSKAKGGWKRQGSSLFLYELDDAFRVRLYFNEGLKILKEGAYSAPAPSDLT